MNYDNKRRDTVDNMTIIAVASIVIAGITIGFGTMGLRWRKGGRSRRR
jgi:hypothetical protein